VEYFNLTKTMIKISYGCKLECGGGPT